MRPAYDRMMSTLRSTKENLQAGRLSKTQANRAMRGAMDAYAIQRAMLTDCPDGRDIRMSQQAINLFDVE
jgi:hypothetical protein